MEMNWRRAALVSIVTVTTLAQGLCAEEGDFDSDGVKIHYNVQGAGESVLLIHGGGVMGLRQWPLSGTPAHLAQDYRVISFDNRGYGKSDKPIDPEAYGTEMAQDAIRLLDHLGVRRAHVVGYSLGGMIAFKILADHPERVKSAFIGGIGWFWPDPDLLGPPGEAPQDERARVRWAMLQRTMELSITREQLLGIKTPMIVVVSDRDRGDAERLKRMSEVRPDIPVVIIENTTHSSLLFKPALADAIKNFIDEHAGAAK